MFMIEIISKQNCELKVADLTIQVKSDQGMGSFKFVSKQSGEVTIDFDLKCLEGFYINDNEICDRTSDDQEYTLVKKVQVEANVEVSIRFMDYYR